ncbi:hypothetical protein V496_05834 [Pseudogymnoascus sp. VKM F-4515 (FW-2607)]|nr:hypothetical protein V496_05834 [Pseudogymnoascus sp. VKM F-4515 (FW-2607)]KFY96831.1 hypothetical protein V498_02424 [Pseudogymnoascus sp. VKM F-4517 (FW-2822)]
MKVSLSLVTLFAALNTVSAAPPSGGSVGGGHDKGHGHGRGPMVNSKALRGLIKEKNLMDKAQILQDFSALSGTPNTRVIGSPGHNATINWYYDTIKKLDDYYSVYIQPFPVVTANGNLTVNNALIESATMSFTGAGHPIAELVPVANVACEAADFPAEVSGKIALISRGTCAFGAKALLAKAAGAVGVVVYNNVDGVVQGTLGEEGDYPPTIGISKAQGEEFLAAIAAGTAQTADLFIEQKTIVTYNVIAETLHGDHDNVIHVGGHSDSVAAGPGINDNGSGGIGILEVALHLTKFKVKNAVRFSWWAAEEVGLLGALHYVKTLPQSELDKIRLYLNFDMIASPNYVLAIYDGDGSTFNVTGPPGSAQAEHLFIDYFRDIEKVDTVPSDFDGRSDYGPFLDAGVACGGLFTGAEGLKTAEEAVMFGGEAKVAYDVNYHAVGDTVANCNGTAFLMNTRAIAHSVAVLGKSTALLEEPLVRRGGYRDFTRASGVPKKVAGGCGTKAF